MTTSQPENGKPLEEGGDDFEILLHSTTGEPFLSFDMVDNNDGTYTVTYHPECPGMYSVDVRVGGLSLRGFPKMVHVREAVASEFAKFEFTVIARDKHKNVKSSGGDQFEVTIKGTSEAMSLQVLDNGDGTYTASYTIGMGLYSVSALLNGKDVAGSPFKQKLGSIVKGDKSSLVHTTTAKTACSLQIALS